jgi:hypothetical protein
MLNKNEIKSNQIKLTHKTAAALHSLTQQEGLGCAAIQTQLSNATGKTFHH